MIVHKPDYSSFFYFNPLPSWVYNLETFKVLDVNQAAIDHYGYSKEEFLELTLKDLRPKHEIPKLITAHLNIKEHQGNIYFGVFTHQKKSGDHIRMKINGHKVDYLGNECMLAVCQDVTENERQSNLQKESEEKLKAASIIAKLGYWRLDLDTKSLSWTDEVFNIWGRDKNQFEVNYENFLKTIHPDDLEVFEKEQNAALAGEKDPDNIHRIILPDNSVKWVHELGRLVRDENGKVIAFEGTVQDITARKKLENDLQHLYDAIPDIICVTDLQGRFLRINKAGCELIGYSEDEILYNTFEKFVHPEDRNPSNDDLIKLHQGRKTYGFENRYINKNGEIIWLSWTSNSNLQEGLIYATARNITSEKKLREINQLASKLARIGSWEIDLIGNKLFWSNMVHELHETDPGEFLPEMEEVIYFYREDFRPMVNATVNNCMQTGAPFDFEAVLVTAQKNERWVRAIGNAEMVDGKCHRIYGSFQDIHEKKKAEEKLILAYQEKNTILESIRDAFFSVNKDWTVTYWNKESENILGKSKDAIVGKNLWEVYPEAIDSDFYRQYHKALETQEIITFEEHYLTLNIWFEVTVYPSNVGLSVYFKDITLRKEADIRLLQANDRFEKVTEATNDAIWDYDVLNNHLFWGKGFYTLFGYKADKTKPSFDLLKSLIHEDDRERIANQVNRYMADSKLKDWFEEFRFLKADGSYAFVIDRATFIRNDEGTVVQVIGAMNDITERKNYENQLLELNESIRQYVSELELTNQELEQFAYIASHDLQEPLRMISSFMDLLKRKYGAHLDDKAHMYIDFATDGAKRMKKIILDLLDYSKAGKSFEVKEKVDLNELQVEYLQLRRKIIAEKSAMITYNNLPQLYTCRAAMTQIFHCLLDNAIKYSKISTPPNIQIAAIENEKEWEFSIKDNGIGIDPKFFDKIFIIFQRLHNNDQFSGTGIGLSIAKKQVEFLGGKIWLESIPGQGSVFYFTVPKIKPSK
jgi:PAS domain S-box-containing protein